MESHAPVLLTAAAFVAALTAGVFLAFSDFIMRGLAQTAPAAGMDAMIQINRTVLRSVFLTSFMALAPVSLGLGAWAYLTLPGPARTLIIAGAAAYFGLVFLVTVLGNVPMNQRLDRLGADHPEGLAYWLRYLRAWTRLNHVRALGNVLAAGFFLSAAGVLTP